MRSVVRLLVAGGCLLAFVSSFAGIRPAIAVDGKDVPTAGEGKSNCNLSGVK